MPENRRLTFLKSSSLEKIVRPILSMLDNIRKSVLVFNNMDIVAQQDVCLEFSFWVKSLVSYIIPPFCCIQPFFKYHIYFCRLLNFKFIKSFQKWGKSFQVIKELVYCL